MSLRVVPLFLGLLGVVLLAGCATRADADSNSVIRKQENDRQIHGEAGAYYGRSG